MNRKEQIKMARKLLTCGALSQETCDAIKRDFLELQESDKKQQKEKSTDKPSMLQLLREHLANTSREQLDAEFEALKEFTISKFTPWNENDTLNLNNAILVAENEWGVDSFTAKWLKTFPERIKSLCIQMKIDVKDSNLSTIKGWIARDKDGRLWFHWEKPERKGDEWLGFTGMFILGGLFPDLKWEDDPIEVELPIIIKYYEA